MSVFVYWDPVLALNLPSIAHWLWSLLALSITITITTNRWSSRSSSTIISAFKSGWCIPWWGAHLPAYWFGRSNIPCSITGLFATSICFEPEQSYMNWMKNIICTSTLTNALAHTYNISMRLILRDKVHNGVSNGISSDSSRVRATSWTYTCTLASRLVAAIKQERQALQLVV